VLYSPSDFKDEQNFLNTLLGQKELLVDIDNINTQLEESRNRIVEEAIAQIGSLGETERRQLSHSINEQMALIRDRLETTRDTVEELTADALYSKMPRSDLQAKILSYTTNCPDGTDIEDISKNVGREKSAVERAVAKLVGRKLLQDENGRIHKC
jgi:hypothetical protein